MQKYSLIFLLLTFACLKVMAIPTKLTVRVKAKDAKFIGTPIGGAYVAIREHLTGILLSNGKTSGSSGDTKLLLQSPHGRNQILTDDQTAKFIATVDIKEPTLVDIEVTAPISRKGAAIKGSTQLWLIPGKDVLGDGIILELPGLILDILAPTTHQIIPFGKLDNKTLSLRISLTMLCGCPISKGGVWNSDDFEVKAILKKEGITLGEYDLTKSAETNILDGKIPIAEKGNYEVQVYAFQQKSNNSGVDVINFVIQ